MKKKKLSGLEQKLISFLEKHMLLLSVLLISLLALYLRKIAVWWNHPGIVSHFDHHANHTESSLFYLLLKFAEYIPILPLHSFKWLGGLSDFLLAALCAAIAGRQNSLKKTLLYILCLFSPVVFLRGIIQAMPDSTAMCLLLSGYLTALKKEEHGLCPAPENFSVRFLLSVILTAFGIALQPGLLLVVTGFYLICHNENKPLSLYRLYLPCLLSFLIQGVCAVLLGHSPLDGFYSQLRFGTFHPVTGDLFATPGDWFTIQFILQGLPLSVISFLYAATHSTKRNISVAVLCQIITCILYTTYILYS